MTEQTRGQIGGDEKESLYFKDPFTDMAFLHTLALHGFKGSEIGECYSAAAQIREGDVESWGEAWDALAKRVEGMARTAEREGHRVSARESYLRAVTSYRDVAWSVPVSDPDYRATIAKSRSLFQRFAALSDPPIEVVAVPYEGTVLPGYLPAPRCQRAKEADDHHR